MSDFSKINHYFENIKKCLSTDKQNDDFCLYLFKYYEKCQQEHIFKITEKEIIQNFERQHSIYYNKTSRLYYDYNNDNFISLNEDNLLYLVLDFLSNNVPIIDITQKNTFKNKIVKRIKDNNIYESIPDSNTIQKSLSLLNETFFHKKAYSKSFLITIGRIILQKKADNDFLVFHV